MNIENCEGREFLKRFDNGSIDLILTDPPYIISHETGMNALHNAIESGKNLEKTETEWLKYVDENDAAKTTPNAKENYMKYGTIYGTKYSVKTNYGEWDENFTMDTLDEFIKLYYQKLRDGGTCIIFFDLWKISHLKELMEKHKFKQIRFIEWIKTNPMPINQYATYLSNAREIAISCVKGGKATFNSKYDNGLYEYPIYSGKDRFHPTQKSLGLFEELIEKHSNKGDIVVDPYGGSATTAVAAINTNRTYLCCEPSDDYFEKGKKRCESAEA